MMKIDELKEFLDEAVYRYNQKNFIENDPICIPHQFNKKEDIEIAGFLIATLAWGNRKTIINNGHKLMQMMGNNPHDFICNSNKRDLKNMQAFVHRTFNHVDLCFFIQSLQHLYVNRGGLETAFACESAINVKDNIMSFRKQFLSTKHQARSEKHLSDPGKNSSAKRLCMFLRWMVRQDKMGVDFGIWKSISTEKLCLPLDVHTGNISRQLGLLKRSQNDWQAVEEVTAVLKELDAKDPIKYDFALFGLGANKALEI